MAESAGFEARRIPSPYDNEDESECWIRLLSYAEHPSFPVELQRQYSEKADEVLSPLGFRGHSYGSGPAIRSSNKSWVFPPVFDAELSAYSEHLDQEVAWSDLRTYAEVERVGVTLFSEGVPEAKARWEEFAGYIRQARTYFQAARKVSGTSASLLLYYCALQLAKAELLQTNPDAVYQVKIPHGLSHDISAAGDPSQDEIVVQNGVFSLLYAKRTGIHLKPKTRIRVLDLIRYIPEISQEVTLTQLGDFRPLPAFHLLVSDSREIWSNILTYHDGFLSDPAEASTQRFLANFREIPAPNNWRQLIGGSIRISPTDLHFYQSRQTTPDYRSKQPAEILHVTAPNLANMVDTSLSSRCDFYLSPTLDAGGDIPMTCGLARYMITFYLSSLVRYKPSLLAPSRYPDFAWIFESFSSQVALPLVVNAKDGILGHWSIFDGRYNT